MILPVVNHSTGRLAPSAMESRLTKKNLRCHPSSFLVALRIKGLLDVEKSKNRLEPWDRRR